MSINRAFSCQSSSVPEVCLLVSCLLQREVFQAKATWGTLQFLLTLKHLSPLANVVFPFFDSLLFGVWGLPQTPPKVGHWALKVLLGKKGTLAHGDTLGGLFLYRYRLLPSEAGNVLDTQLGIARLRQKTMVVKPDSWHTQANTQLFVRVTLFVLMLGTCWWQGKERLTLKNILMMNFQLSAFCSFPASC